MIVNESQEAVLFKEGLALDRFTAPHESPGEFSRKYGSRRNIISPAEKHSIGREPAPQHLLICLSLYSSAIAAVTSEVAMRFHFLGECPYIKLVLKASVG